MNRRDFLTTTAAGIAAAATCEAVTCEAAADDKPAANAGGKKLRVVVVGR